MMKRLMMVLGVLFTMNSFALSPAPPNALFAKTARDFEMSIEFTIYNDRGREWVINHLKCKDKFNQDKNSAVLHARLNHVFPKAILYTGQLYGDFRVWEYTVPCHNGLDQAIESYIRWDSSRSILPESDYYKRETLILNKMNQCIQGINSK